MSSLEFYSAASPDAMIVADDRGLIRHWNAAAERMFGLKVSEALGTSLDIIVPEPMRGAHAEGMKRLLAGGKPRVVGSVVEVTAQHVDGRFFPIEMSLSMWTEDGQARFGAMIRDVSSRRANDERLHHLAHYDQLTLLPNRVSFLEKIEAALSPTTPATVMLVDLDRFKEVNDQHGHAAGDAVLIETALRIKRCVPGEIATVARLSGDEFAILLQNTANPLQADAIAKKLRDELRRPFDLDGHLVWVGCSVGIAMSPSHGEDAATLIGSADLALYKAKAEGGDQQSLFVPTLKAVASARRSLETELRTAWERREFELYYQPQVRLKDRKFVGAEALLRWQHPVRGLLQPSAFIETLENSSLAAPVGQWILESACKQAALWNEAVPGFLMGVNLFSAQLKSDPLPQIVQHVLASTKFPARQLELEITENIMLNDGAMSKEQLQQLHDMGVGLAFDDYGTGYASLAFLKQFPITRLKIDRGFVSNVRADGADAAIVMAVIMLARRFGLSVIAEGIETEEQEVLLKKWRCPQAQGYLYSKPVSAQVFGCMLARPREEARQLAGA
jgi:diguanylate cyclase (GGDEF)-like protein/PAS domain S-box-containing protein